MNKKIKLVVTDIDGTIVEVHGSPQKEIISIFDELKQSGVRVVLATGRMYKAAQHIADTLHVDTPIICYQGAIIRDKNETYFEQNVPKNIAIELIKKLREYKVHINLYLKDRLIVESDDNYIKTYAGDRIVKYEVVPDLLEVVDDVIASYHVMRAVAGIAENRRHPLLAHAGAGVVARPPFL